MIFKAAAEAAVERQSAKPVDACSVIEWICVVSQGGRATSRTQLSSLCVFGLAGSGWRPALTNGCSFLWNRVRVKTRLQSISS